MKLDKWENKKEIKVSCLTLFFELEKLMQVIVNDDDNNDNGYNNDNSEDLHLARTQNGTQDRNRGPSKGS